MKINPRITEQTQSEFVKVVTKRTKASRHIVLFIYAKATNIYRDSFTSGGGKVKCPTDISNHVWFLKSNKTKITLEF